MDKNSVTGMILIAVILGFFWWMNKPTEEQLAAQKRYRDSVERVEAENELEEAKQQRNLELAKKNEKESTPDSVLQKQRANKYGLFANAVDGENKFYTLENELIKVTFASQGGKYILFS